MSTEKVKKNTNVLNCEILKTLNILIALDGKRLINHLESGELPKGSPANPTNLGAYGTTDIFIAKIKQNYRLLQYYHSKEDLETLKSSEAELQWGITTAENDSNYSAYLYEGVFNPNIDMKKKAFKAEASVIYVPTTQGFTGNLTKSNIDIATGNFLKPGLVLQYILSFALVDNQSKSTIGYFTWDPFVTNNC